MKGSYVLLIELENDREIRIGKLGNLFFKRGYYAYVGSALNGLEQRVNRHLRREKKLHWHIDYLLQYGNIIDIFYNENVVKEECNFAKKFEKKLPPVLNFGCSDCSCKSHLFYGPKNEIISITNSLDVSSYC